MPAPDTPSESGPQPPVEAASATPHKRPWGWIALSVLLIAGVVGLAIYAAGVNSDLDDANAKIAAQQKQIDEAEGKGDDVVAAAAKSAYADLRAKAGAAQQNTDQAVEQANQVLDQADQAAADAKGTADELEAQAAAAQAKAESAATCARSFLSAFSGVFDAATVEDGVDAAVAELKTLQPQCASAIQAAGA
jgi:chromosome segregation ATPase